MPHPLLDGSPDARAAALAALAGRAGAPDEAEWEGLADCLADAHKVVQRRAAEVFATLARRGLPVEPHLHAALAALELRRRWGAVYALSLIGPLPREALPTLLDAIGLDDGDLRWAAAELIKQIAASDRDAVVARLLAAAQVPSPQRKMALYCLRDLEVGEAFDVALAALADEHSDTRLAALAVVAAVHPDRTVAAQRIARLIDDPDPRMRRAAAGTLGGLGVRSAAVLEALHCAEGSDDPSLRRAAVTARRRLG